MSGSDALRIRSDVAPDAWDEYVARMPAASAYHFWRWRAVFEQAFGHETRYLAATRGTAIAGVLPLVLFRSVVFGRFIVSLPFVNYGGIVADDREAADALVAETDRIARAGGYEHVELRHRERARQDLVAKQHKVAMIMPLAPTSAAAWDGLDRKVRNQIRKAQKSGLTAAAGDAGRLDDFYGIFARNMRDLGTPVYGRVFFERVLQACGDRAAVFVVERDGAPAAAAIALWHRSTIEVPWASSLGEFRSLCPNHMLYWSIIEWAIDRGFSHLDFGRSTPNEGTYHFKRQWGAVAAPMHWEYQLLRRSALPDQSPKNPKFRAAIEAWKRCPLWLTNALGPHIVRSIP